jgi:hypothetical protein
MKANSLFLSTFYLIFFLIGFLTYKDYGIGIEEIFQKASGFYWLKYLLSKIGFIELANLSNTKLLEVYEINPGLPKVIENLSYGIVFDVPSALLEILFNFENFSQNIYLKHFLSFLVFFVSCICFSNILIKRFSNLYVTIFGTLAYCFSPKIYGASFFDGKDLFFLSLFTITIYFYQNFELKQKTINLFIFALFAAFLTSTRPPGLMIAISFLFIYFLMFISNVKEKNSLKIISYFILIYSIFLYAHWPYLWNFLNYNIDQMFINANVTFFFDGEFYKQRSLPTSYIPKWIFISTPIFILFFFIIGLILILRRFFLRLINIRENSNILYKYDFWRSTKEKIDFFILLFFFQTIIIYLSFNEELTASWRHFFFFHFILVYFFSFSIFLIFSSFKKKKVRVLIASILFLLNIEMFYKSYLYHPYQYSYFNNFMSKKEKKMFERDTAHLSRLEAMRDILRDINNDNNNDNIIRVGNGSATPIADVMYMFNEKQRKKIILIGNDNLQSADYIYTNYIYEINTRFNKKYEIPKNFKLYKSLEKNDTLIYSIYKKK